jgi:hypothetical protein
MDLLEETKGPKLTTAALSDHSSQKGDFEHEIFYTKTVNEKTEEDVNAKIIKYNKDREAAY